MKNQIKVGAIISYFSIFVNVIMGLIYTPWMIKTIGQSDYALYVLATSIITMFTIDFGLSTAVSRFTSKYVAEGDKQKENDFLGLAYKLYMLISLASFLILLIVFVFLDKIYVSLSPEELYRFKIVYGIAGAYSVISFPFITFNGILTAHERFIELKICDLFNKIGTVLLVVLALLSRLGLFSLVFANALMGIVTIVVKFYFIKRNTTINVNFNFWDKNLLMEIFGFSFWTTIGSIAQNFLVVIAPSILAIVSNTTEVAIFGFANSIGSYICLLATGIDGFFIPRISRIVSSNKQKEELTPLMIKVGRFQLFVLGLVAVGFLCLGKKFILLVMGKEYLLAYKCVLFYLVYSIICYPQQIGNTALIVTNNVKTRAIISMIAALVNVSLSFGFSYLWGSIGTCFALCIAIILRTILLDIKYKKILHIDLKQYFKKCHLSFLPVWVLVMIVSMSFSYLIKEVTWFTFVIEVIFICIIYFIGCLFVMNKKEKNIFKFLKSK